MDFSVSADHKMKMKEGDKIELYLDITKELKKLEK